MTRQFLDGDEGEPEERTTVLKYGHSRCFGVYMIRYLVK